MEAYKLVAAFDNFNKVVDFYRNELGKPEKKTMATLASMGSKGQIVNNPDGSVSVIWFFRTFSKYDKFTNSFLNYLIIPSAHIPQQRKTHQQVISE